ncbi:MAG: thioredoxin family protein, partial [Bacteroidota bacterium]
MHKLLHFSFISSFLLFFIYSQASFGQGINFVKGSWEEVLTMARKERKLVFVDAYTTWCGPCKAMDRNTFPKAEVGDFFSENFISYKLDMEKGEGPEIGSKYAVVAYPTMLFVNYQGDIVHRIMGYRGPKELLGEARSALSPSKNKATIELEYESGNREPDIIREYAIHQKEAGRDYRDYADEYFATQQGKALLSKKNWQAIQELSHSLAGSEYLFLIKKQKKFIRSYGAKPVLGKIYEVMKAATLESGLTGNPAKYKAALSLAEKRLKDKGQTANRLKMTYTEARKNWKSYAERAIYHYDTYPISQPKELDHSAKLFYRHIEEAAKLETALRWTRQSIAMENEAYNNETRARLFMKLGRYDEALRSANQALQIAQFKEQQTGSL